MKRSCIAILAAGLLCAAAPVLAADEAGSVGVGHWKPGEKGGAETVTIGERHVDKVHVDGEDIYLNGLLQKEKYTPGARIELKDGRVVVIPPAAGPAQ
jgi:hypothetical protein